VLLNWEYVVRTHTFDVNTLLLRSHYKVDLLDDKADIYEKIVFLNSKLK